MTTATTSHVKTIKYLEFIVKKCVVDSLLFIFDTL